MRICCWRFSRVRSFSARVAGVVPGPGQGQRVAAVEVMRPGPEIEREAAVLDPSADLRADPAGLHRDPADIVDELGEVGQVDDDHVVDPEPGELLDRLDRQRRPAVGVGGIDLAHAVAGDRGGRVPGDREPAGDPAADPPEHQRVRTAARVVGVGSGLLRADRALVGADDQDGVRRGEHVPARGQCRLGGGREVALVGLGADQEQHERQQQPGADRQRQVLQSPLPGPPAATRTAPAPARFAAGGLATGRLGQRDIVLTAQAGQEPPGARSISSVWALVLTWAGAFLPAVDPVRRVFGLRPVVGFVGHPGCAYSDATCLPGAPSVSTWAGRSYWPARSMWTSRSTIAPSGR